MGRCSYIIQAATRQKKQHNLPCQQCTVGALATDRVAKFLGHRGLAPMPVHVANPVQSLPKKKAQERAKAAG